MALDWYALHVKPHKERMVAKHLLANQIETFYPFIHVQPQNPRAAKQRPFFPGYLFVQIDLEQLGQNALRWTPGVHGLVQFGDHPVVVPERLIQELKKRLNQIEAQPNWGIGNFQKGDRVQIIHGPLSGYEAIFDIKLAGQDRVRVLLAILSQHPHPVKLHVSDIQKINKKGYPLSPKA